MSRRLMQVEVQQYKKMQSHVLQCGVLTRSSRLLLNCRTSEDLAETLGSTFGALALSGLLRIEVAGSRTCRHFGGSLTGEGTTGEPGRVPDDAKVVFFRTPHLSILGKQEGIFVPVAALQDNLSVFIDTVEAWLVKYEADLQRNRTLESETLRSTAQMEALSKGLCDISSGLLTAGQQVFQELLSRLLAQFPALALQADQEEAILETVTLALAAQERQIEVQSEQLQRLARDLATAVRQCGESIDGQRRVDADLAFKRVVGAIHLRSAHNG